MVERPVPAIAWFEGGPLDGRERHIAGPLPESLTAWQHRHVRRVVEIGRGTHIGYLRRDAPGDSWHGDRQRDLWEPHRYDRVGAHTFRLSPGAHDGEATD